MVLALRIRTTDSVQETAGGEGSVAWCTRGDGKAATGLVPKTGQTENPKLLSRCGEQGVANHSFSSGVNAPQTCWAEIWKLWPPGGLTARGSGIVSTAATKSSRQTKYMANLNFKSSSNTKEAAIQTAVPFLCPRIIHLIRNCRYFFYTGKRNFPQESCLLQRVSCGPGQRPFQKRS
jgi:hypothetical protein